MKYIIYIFLLFQCLAFANDKSPKILRVVEAVDYLPNRIGNIRLNVYNSGYIAFRDSLLASGSLVAPFNSKAQYVNSIGVIVGAKKDVDAEQKKIAFSTIHPHTLEPFAVPGSIEDGNEIDLGKINNYRVYRSGDYSKNDATMLFGEEGPNWSLFSKNESEFSSKFGYYINDESKRFVDTDNKVVMAAHEVFFNTFKPTNAYSQFSENERRNLGLPLLVDIQRRTLIWNYDDTKTSFAEVITLINKEEVDLIDCQLGIFADIDITSQERPFLGLNNDRITLIEYINSKNRNDSLIVAFSDTSSGERNINFGYIGFKLLHSPQIGTDNFIQNMNKGTNLNKQSGLNFAFSIPNDADIYAPDSFYDVIDNSEIGFDRSANDVKLAFGSKGFNLRSGDTAHIIYISSVLLPQSQQLSDYNVSNMIQLIENVREMETLLLDDFLKVANSEPVKKQISITPSVVSELFFVNLENDNGEFIKSVYLFDIRGNLVLERINLNSQSLQLSSSDLASGFFMVKVLTNSNEYLEKIIKIE